MFYEREKGTVSGFDRMSSRSAGEKSPSGPIKILTFLPGTKSFELGLCLEFTSAKNNFSSYKAGYGSSIVITMDSTLGFELLGFGKKVLFCAATIDNALQHKENINYIFHKMPNIVLLDNLTQQDFNNKMNELVNMEDEEYLRQTEAARKYYMKFQKLPPHKIISDFIHDNVLM